MKTLRLAFALMIAAGSAAVSALPADGPVHWECVPIARLLSGIEIRGNAWTWWSQAEGRYERGATPKRGAVLTFKPYGAMQLGHVAAVTKVVDDRTILVTHSNWSPINGERGQIERNVKIVDVSESGDWSRVRVWFAPSQDLGSTAYPVYGFIYPAGNAPMRLPGAAGVVAKPTAVGPTSILPASFAALHVVEPVSVSTPSPTGRLNYMRKMLSGIK